MNNLQDSKNFLHCPLINIDFTSDMKEKLLNNFFNENGIHINTEEYGEFSLPKYWIAGDTNGIYIPIQYFKSIPQNHKRVELIPNFIR